MKKRAALGYFITLSILIVISFVFSFVSIPLPTTNYIFKGFLNSIPKGVDFGGGAVAIYDVEKDHFDGSNAKAMNLTLSKLSELLNKNYNEPRILQVGDNQIKVIVPATNINSNYLVGTIEISTEDLSEVDHTGDHDHAAHAQLNGSHIDKVLYVSANGNPTVKIDFTEEGKAILHEMTEGFSSSAEGTVYLYADKNYESPLLQVNLSSPVENGYIQLSGGSLTTRANAEEVVGKIQSGKLGINMARVGEVETIDPIFAPAVVTLIQLSLFLIIILSFIYLYLRYRELGLVAILSLSVFLSLSFIIMPFFNFIVLSMATIIGAIMLYLSVFLLHVLFIENIRRDYESGKKFAPSFKSGYLKTIPTLIDFFSVTLIFSIFGFAIAGGVIKSISSIILPGSVIAAFVLFLVFRGLTKWYLVLNNSKYNKVNFNKAGAENEEI